MGYLGSNIESAIAAGQMRRARPAPYNEPRTLRASAERITDPSSKAHETRYTSWQQDAWDHFESIGEVHYGFTMLSNMLSRVRLYAAAVVGHDQAPVPLTEVDESNEEIKVNSAVADRAEYFVTALGNVSSMIRAFTLNWNVAGECYLVRMPDEGYTIRSTSEIKPIDRGYQVQQSRTAKNANTTILPSDTFVARIWQEHPRYSRDPDSSMVGISESCQELLMISRLTRAIARSRMNAGVLYVPDGVSIMAGTSNTEERVDPDTGETITVTTDPGNAFLDELIQSMVTPISDENSASSVVPMVITGPSEYATQLHHLPMTRQTDEWLVTRADRALERILQGIDLPKDVVTGLANIKYTNATVIDENLYKAHIEPLALALVDALTTVYLHPMLKSAGFSETEIRKVAIWYDPSEVVVRPNRSDDATKGYDRHLLSGDAWRREHGFSDADKPTEEEVARSLALNKAQIPPDVAAALFQELLPTLLGSRREEAMAKSVVPFPDSARQALEGEG